MDFNFTEEQSALGDLAREILAKELTQARSESRDQNRRAIWLGVGEWGLAFYFG